MTMTAKPLDPVLVATIQGVVDQKVAANELFTAFDISRVVQHLGHRERHNNMKHIVHDYFQQGNLTGYDRTLVPVETNKPEAWVYHPIGVPATNYKPVPLSLPSNMTPQSFYGGASPDPVPIPNSLSSITFQPPAKGRRGRGPDARGALAVPATLIRQIGANAGDVLYVNHVGNTLVVSKTGAGWKYNVNSSFNIRIKRKRWSLVAGTNGNWNFREDNGNIVVEYV